MTTTLTGTPDPEPNHDAAGGGVGLEPAPEVVEGELLTEEQAAALARRRGLRRWVPARVVVLAVQVRRCERGALVWRGVQGATGVLHVIYQGFASWGRRAWDASTLGAYRRQIKAAEALGDRALLAEWTQRREQAAQARHQRLLELPALATGLASLAAGAVVGLVVTLLVLGLLVWLSGTGSVVGPVLAALTVASWACTFIALIWTPAVASIPVWVLVAAWREGRRRGSPPGWLRINPLRGAQTQGPNSRLHPSTPGDQQQPRTVSPISPTRHNPLPNHPRTPSPATATAPNPPGPIADPSTDTVTAPLTGRPPKPSSSPPQSPPAAYDHSPAKGPGRTPRHAQRRWKQTKKIRVELPPQPPQLTPEAALALLRILLKARAAREHQQGHRPLTGHPSHCATDPEGKG